jgi:hypothetical protein
MSSPNAVAGDVYQEFYEQEEKRKQMLRDKMVKYNIERTNSPEKVDGQMTPLREHSNLKLLKSMEVDGKDY